MHGLRQEISDQRVQITRLNERIDSLHADILASESRRFILEEQNRQVSDECTLLRERHTHTVASLEEDRSNLISRLDEERIAKVRTEEQCTYLHDRVQQLEQSLSEMEEKNSVLSLEQQSSIQRISDLESYNCALQQQVR